MEEKKWEEKKVVRIPRCSPSVKKVIERAYDTAISRRWKKVVIVAMDENGDYQIETHIDRQIVIAMLEIAKDMALREMYE